MLGTVFPLKLLIFCTLFFQKVAPFERFELIAPNEVTWAKWGELYKDRTPENSSLAVYKFRVKEGDVVRFWLTSNANRSAPLLAVCRETTTVVSAQLPIIVKNLMYNSTARTLCPFVPNWHHPRENLTLSVELSSYRSVDYQFSAILLQNFTLKLSSPQHVTAAASEPVYLQFNIPDHLDSVVVRVNSNSSICMTISIQEIGCPVFDMESNVLSTGIHQTISGSGSITVERKEMERFYVVFVVRPNDDDCSGEIQMIPVAPRESSIRMKNFTVVVEEAPTENMYFLPVLATSAFFLLIMLITLVFVILMDRYERRKLVVEVNRYRSLTAEDPDTPGPSRRRHSVEHAPEATDLADDSSLEGYDILPDLKNKEVVRAKVHLTVADLSMKTQKQRDSKYNIYAISLLTLCLFYGLPVVQLVLNWQATVRLSGDLDLCWYNFGCSRPFLGFFNFNNIFSNSGYIVLGVLFMAMVKIRHIRYKRLAALFPADLVNDYGLPQHNGLMYAIGIAVVMEGILSASYHICPSSANYQFDTSFMYIIGMLGMLKVYQLRHPDINANAHVSFAVMAFFILTAMIGVYINNLWFWIVFSVGYMITMWTISIEFYFKGQWRLNIMELWRSLKYEFISSRMCSCFIPTYKGRFLFLVTANAVNLGYVCWGVLRHPRDFQSFLLLPFIANLFLYLLYYIFMKYVHRESLSARAFAFLGVSALCWLLAAWFFLHNVSDWSVTPAESRQLNHPCILLDFYDNHDVWHLLSSLGIFSAFSLMMCIDDDLIWVKRDKIAVF